MKGLNLELAKMRRLFLIPIEEKMSLSAPMGKNRFTLLLNKTCNNDFQVSLDTFMHLDNGNIIAHAHSDDPCSIIYKSSGNEANKFSFFAKTTSNDKNIASGKLSYILGFQHPINMDLIRVRPSIKFVVVERPFEWSNIDLRVKSSIKYRNFGVSFAVAKSPLTFKISPFLEMFGKHSVSLRFGKDTLIPKFASSFSYENFTFAANSEYKDRSIHLFGTYDEENVGKFGVCLEVKHIGHGPEFLAQAVSDLKVGEDSNIKIVAGTNRIVSAELTVPYKGFMKMVFAGELEFKTRKPVARFGANINFYK